MAVSIPGWVSKIQSRFPEFSSFHRERHGVHSEKRNGNRVWYPEKPGYGVARAWSVPLTSKYFYQLDSGYIWRQCQL